jgi:uncharacterized RDD family membrane protein YckC
MRKIDITTTQNVTIEYELATVVERMLSSAIDACFIYVASWFIQLIITEVWGNSDILKYIYIVIPFSFFYHLLFEALNHGQTPGKMILKIRVVKITGERPVFFDFLMRTVFRMVDITATLGTLALITASSSEKGQRLGDFFAETTVVKLLNFNNFGLDRVLSMEKLKSYQPVYPGVMQFKEEEMLLVKETLERRLLIRNKSHNDAMLMLVKKIEAQLGITAPKDKEQFLRTLIKDYVSLTRY